MQDFKQKFNAGDKVRLKFPTEVFRKGVVIDNSNCDLLFKLEGLKDPGWGEEMNSLIAINREAIVEQVSTNPDGLNFGYYVEGYWFPASCLELVKEKTKSSNETNIPFKRGDLVIRKNATALDEPFTVTRVFKDVDTDEITLELDDEFGYYPDSFELFDAKVVRKKELEEKIKALQEELKSL